MRKGRAQGLDGISAELLQSNPHVAARLLHPLYIKFIMQGREALHAKAGKAVPFPRARGALSQSEHVERSFYGASW